MLFLKYYFYYLIIYLTLIGVALSNSGGPSGNYANNAPSYNNCTQCHSGSVNPTGGSVSITGLPSSGYVPGESYSLTVNVSGTHSRGYGFQMASQVGNDNAGTFSLGSASESSELNGNRVQHSTRTVSGEWIIDWLAPSSDVGDITFSVSGLATGGSSGNTQALRIYSSNSGSPTASITALGALSKASCKPFENPSKSVVRVASFFAYKVAASVIFPSASVT